MVTEISISKPTANRKRRFVTVISHPWTAYCPISQELLKIESMNSGLLYSSKGKLIRKMLKVHPHERPSAIEILNDKWIEEIITLLFRQVQLTGWRYQYLLTKAMGFIITFWHVKTFLNRCFLKLDQWSMRELIRWRLTLMFVVVCKFEF
jgi:hypothetical protein